MVLVAAAEKPRDAVHGYVGEGSDPSRNGDGCDFGLWTLDSGLWTLKQAVGLQRGMLA
jgi:hypothetical protein